MAGRILRRIISRTLMGLAFVVAPLAFCAMLLHVVATVGLILFGLMVWVALIPLHGDIREWKAARFPTKTRVPAPRVQLADEQVDAVFQQMIDEESSRGN